MRINAKTARRLESLCLDMASEAELTEVAQFAQGDTARRARAVLLERARELARRAAQDLARGLDHVWPGWQASVIHPSLHP